MKDVIIVGGGIAGTTLAWQWHLQGKSIYWIADNQTSSSHVAAGVFNPVVLKRFSPVWKAQEQLEVLFPFYSKVKDYLSKPIIEIVPVWRRFHDPKERATWVRKSIREDLDYLMATTPIDDQIMGIDAPDGFGMVNHTGWLDTLTYMQVSNDYFKSREECVQEHFDYNDLGIEDHEVVYKNTRARSIIFAEGNQLTNNPWFGKLPLQGNKGQVLIIKCPGLELKQIIKSSVFLMPYKEDLFWVGATYDRDYATVGPTAEAREYLKSKLDTFLKLPYEIVEQKSGIRPTTKDRRPFIGPHPDFKSLYVFNGMGSRASIIAPWASKHLFESMYLDVPLPVEMDVSRFNR